jgi:hypothetical protein
MDLEVPAGWTTRINANCAECTEVIHGGIKLIERIKPLAVKLGKLKAEPSTRPEADQIRSMVTGSKAISEPWATMSVNDILRHLPEWDHVLYCYLHASLSNRSKSLQKMRGKGG